MLYAMDLDSHAEPEQVCKSFWSRRKGLPTVRDFANELVRGVATHNAQLVELIKKHCANWNFDRIGMIERNVLRLALYEIIYLDDIPYQVSINEAIELARLFGTQDSCRFVNGLLDAIVQAKSDEEGQRGAEDRSG